MAQEIMTKAYTFTSPFNKARNIRQHKAAFGVDTHHGVAFPGGFFRTGPQQRRHACEQKVSEVFHRHRL